MAGRHRVQMIVSLLTVSRTTIRWATVAWFVSELTPMFSSASLYSNQRNGARADRRAYRVQSPSAAALLNLIPRNRIMSPQADWFDGAPMKPKKRNKKEGGRISTAYALILDTQRSTRGGFVTRNLNGKKEEDYLFGIHSIIINNSIL